MHVIQMFVVGASMLFTNMEYLLITYFGINKISSLVENICKC